LQYGRGWDMGRYKVILFNLDGTLSDTKEGITKSVQYALEKLDVFEPDLDKLESFIGPPLQVSFAEVYGFDEKGLRKRFNFIENVLRKKGCLKINYILG
jgi:phosphoglycolate phosphatase